VYENRELTNLLLAGMVIRKLNLSVRTLGQKAAKLSPKWDQWWDSCDGAGHSA